MVIALQTQTKRTLFHLTRALERTHLVDAGPNTLGICLFEQRRHFEQSQTLHERWAHSGGPTLVVGVPGHPPYGQRGNMHTVWVRDDNPLADEWLVLATDGTRAVALSAHALPDQDGVPEMQRAFQARLTLSPHEVAEEILRVADALDDELSPALRTALADKARVCALLPEPGTAERLQPLLDAVDAEALAPLRARMEAASASAQHP